MITPNKKDIAIELIEKTKVTNSGIILSAADPAEANKGRVVAIGKDVTLVNVDDVVLPNWNSNKGKFTYEEKDLWIIPESEIVGVFDSQ
jgi:co-chaperonin GroES (HSP10)